MSDAREYVKMIMGYTYRNERGGCGLEELIGQLCVSMCLQTAWVNTNSAPLLAVAGTWSCGSFAASVRAAGHPGFSYSLQSAQGMLQSVISVPEFFSLCSLITCQYYFWPICSHCSITASNMRDNEQKISEEGSKQQFYFCVQTKWTDDWRR